MIAANDITAVFLTIPLIFYLNRKNKAFWCGVGQLVAALANFLPLLAFLIVPSTYVKSGITGEEDVELCSNSKDQGRDDCGLQDGRDWGKVVALGCFFVCKLCSGVAQQALGNFTQKTCNKCSTCLFCHFGEMSHLNRLTGPLVASEQSLLFEQLFPSKLYYPPPYEPDKNVETLKTGCSSDRVLNLSTLNTLSTL